MIIQDVYLKDYAWDIRIYYYVDKYYIDKIMNNLYAIGCSKSEMRKIQRLLSRNRYNIGFTYSNVDCRCSIIVIGKTSCPDEFQDTLDHEKGHVVMHISEINNIDPFSEDMQYLSGDIGKAMFPIAKLFLCEHCKEYINSYVKE